MKKYFILLAIVVVGCTHHKSGWLVKAQDGNYYRLVSRESIDEAYELELVDTNAIKKLMHPVDSAIDVHQIWPASSGAKIHIYNLDSGKGYIFRKYQNKLPKKHIIDIDDYIKYSGITNPEIIDSLRQQELERILRELEQYNKPLMHKEK